MTPSPGHGFYLVQGRENSFLFGGRDNATGFSYQRSREHARTAPSLITLPMGLVATLFTLTTIGPSRRLIVVCSGLSRNAKRSPSAVRSIPTPARKSNQAGCRSKSWERLQAVVSRNGIAPAATADPVAKARLAASPAPSCRLPSAPTAFPGSCSMPRPICVPMLESYSFLHPRTWCSAFSDCWSCAYQRRSRPVTRLAAARELQVNRDDE